MIDFGAAMGYTMGTAKDVNRFCVLYTSPRASQSNLLRPSRAARVTGDVLGRNHLALWRLSEFNGVLEVHHA